MDEDWQFYYPQRARRWYLNLIQDHGYDRETAEKIIMYLPQTDTQYITANITQMIRLFEEGKPSFIPPGCDPAKKKIALNKPDYWDTEPYSPRAEDLKHQGYIEEVTETFRSLSEEKHIPVKNLVENSGISEETKEEVLALLENGGEW